MANRLKGEASFEDDGKTLTVVFDAEALLEIEDRLDCSVFALFATPNDIANIRLGMLAQVLAVGLSRHHGEVARGAAADMLLANPAAQQAMSDALERAMPDRSAEGNGKARPAARRKARAGTGTKS